MTFWKGKTIEPVKRSALARVWGKKCKKAKQLYGQALQIAVKRREAKSKGEKGRYKHLNVEFQRIPRRDKDMQATPVAQFQKNK